MIDNCASWLCINPVVGCTNNCFYCFLADRGSSNINPVILDMPEHVIDNLLCSSLYEEHIPICLMSETEPFLDDTNIRYTFELLNQIFKHHLCNPIILVTKRIVPERILRFIEEKKINVLFFLSYSGLPSRYEPKINRKDIEYNFRHLSNRGHKIVHYFRPLLEANSDLETMLSIIEFVKDFAVSSVVTGAKITRNLECELKDYLALRDIPLYSYWPNKAEDNLNEIISRYPSYPIYKHASCAVANALGISDYNGMYNRTACKTFNRCSELQREKCKKGYDERKVSKVHVQNCFMMNNIDISIENIHYDKEKDIFFVTSSELIPQRILFNVRQRLNIKVCSNVINNYW